MGTAELSCASLRALAAVPEFQLVAVVTQPDRPKGRDLRLQPSPVKVVALELNLPVLQPERARCPEFVEELSSFAPDLIAVAAYGQILPQSLLDLPPYGCLNVHTSLLPRYRGAAPIQWAILNDDAETGVTIMKVEAGLDTGPIVSMEKTPILATDTAASLHDRLAQMGAALLVRTIPGYVAGTTLPRTQPSEGVVYAHKIKKQDGQLDWSQPARALWNRVRSLVPWPGAYTFQPGPNSPQLLKIWEAQVVNRSGNPGEVLAADATGVLVGCGADALLLQVLQREGGRRLAAAAFLAGHPLAPGTRLG